ncbi:arabinogalactan oligomer/maltooligosaccharide transport system substrate-binding protein [Alkalihalobacillus xiaoxiensis]|uniref:Maltodextrin-binding protein n=1 Tax=Shouchella xiaoxiensis TaxID=766895 RepID=A0ABS2SVD5_9BACI|nr:maltose ABC transporter substrate-binding protein [Shouchella xiaoxiensis]MBM7839498.1 arabinogalactan oligomer/maltooligosaccharide transport system substrate-binding protein [Shouchella xiaoxiensis]
MTFKKTVGTLISGALVASIMVGCSPENTDPGTEEEKENEPAPEVAEDIQPEEGASLVLWDNSDEEAEWAQYVAEEFEKEYGVPVEFQEVGHTEAASKLETDGPAGLGADVFNSAHDHLGNMVSAGLVYDNYFASEYQDAFLEAAVNGTSFVGKDGQLEMYGFPIAIETYALYYNKDIIEEPPATWDELFESAAAFQEGSSGSDRKFGFMMEPGNFYYTHAFLAGFGGYVFGENNTDPTDLGIDNDGAVESGLFMQRIHDELLPLTKEDITGDVISSFFNDNKLAYRISGPWDIKNHEDAGVNFGIAPLPTLENGEAPQSFSGIKAYYVNSYSEFPQAATLLAQFASSEEMLLKRYEMTGQLPPVHALLEDPTIQSNEASMAFLEQAVNAVPMPNIPQMNSVWGPMEVAYTSIWNNNMDPQEALSSAREQIEDAISTQSN